MNRPLPFSANAFVPAGLVALTAFSLLASSASLAGAQARLRALTPPSATLKRHATATRFTAADLVTRLRATASGRQELARAGARTAAPTSGSSSGGWPSTFQITADAGRVTSSQNVGQHSVAMTTAYSPVAVSSDDAGQMMIEAHGSSNDPVMWYTNFNPLPPGWYAVSFEMRLEDEVGQPEGLIYYDFNPYSPGPASTRDMLMGTAGRARE